MTETQDAPPAEGWGVGALAVAGWPDAEAGKHHPCFARDGGAPAAVAVEVIFQHGSARAAELRASGAPDQILEALERARREFVTGAPTARLRNLERALREAKEEHGRAEETARVRRHATLLALNDGRGPEAHERARVEAMALAVVLADRIGMLAKAAAEARKAAKNQLELLMRDTRDRLLAARRAAAQAELARARAAVAQAAGPLLPALLAAHADAEALRAGVEVESLLELPAEPARPGPGAGAVADAGGALPPADHVIGPVPAAGPGRADDEPAADEPADGVAAFLAERCAVGEGQEVRSQELFEAWQAWCAERGLDAGLDSTFAKDLRRLVPGIETKQPRIDGERPRVLAGVGLVCHEAAALAAVEG